MIEQFFRTVDWDQGRWLLPWLFAFSAITFIGSIVVGWLVLIHLPEDYLTRDDSHQLFRSKSKLVNLAIHVVKNVLGVGLLFAGVVMLFTPGQGILSIVVGIELIEFPGKRRLIRKILAYPTVLNAINKIRTRSNKPPLEPVTRSTTVAS